MSGVPQGSVLEPLLFISFTAEMWNNNNTTFYSEISAPSDCVKVADSSNRDLLRTQTWCSAWGMKLNPNKTHSIIFSRSRTALPQHPPLSLCGVELKTSTFLKLLFGIVLDNKLTF